MSLRSYMLVFVKEVGGYAELFSYSIILCGNEQEALSCLPEMKAHGYPLGVRWVDGAEVRAWPQEGVRFQGILDLGPHAPLERQPKKSKKPVVRRLIRYRAVFNCIDGTWCSRTVVAETKYEARCGIQFLLENHCVIGFSEGGVSTEDYIASEGDVLHSLLELGPVPPGREEIPF